MCDAIYVDAEYDDVALPEIKHMKLKIENSVNRIPHMPIIVSIHNKLTKETRNYDPHEKWEQNAVTKNGETLEIRYLYFLFFLSLSDPDVLMQCMCWVYLYNAECSSIIFLEWALF